MLLEYLENIEGRARASTIEGAEKVVAAGDSEDEGGDDRHDDGDHGDSDEGEKETEEKTGGT